MSSSSSASISPLLSLPTQTSLSEASLPIQRSNPSVNEVPKVAGFVFTDISVAASSAAFYVANFFKEGSVTVVSGLGLGSFIWATANGQNVENVEARLQLKRKILAEVKEHSLIKNEINKDFDDQLDRCQRDVERIIFRIQRAYRLFFGEEVGPKFAEDVKAREQRLKRQIKEVIVAHRKLRTDIVHKKEAALQEELVRFNKVCHEIQQVFSQTFVADRAM